MTKAADVSQFVKTATDDELAQLEAAAKDAEAKTVVQTLDEALYALKCGTLDPVAVRCAIENWRYEKDRSAWHRKLDEEEKAEKARLESLRNSPEMAALKAKMKDLKRKYDALSKQEFAVSFTVPVKAKLTLKDDQGFAEFFQTEFQGEVQEILDVYQVGDLKLEITEGHNFGTTQVKAIQAAMKDLVESYECEMVTALFPLALKAINDLYQHAKNVAIEYDRLTEGNFDIESLISDE